MTLIEKLERGPGSRKLSDECLLAVGWPKDKVTPGNVRYVKDRPDSSQNLQDALDWMVPEEWHVDCLATPDLDCHPENPAAQNRVLLRPDLNNDAGWKCGMKEAFAATPALALCAASLRAREAMKEKNDENNL